MRVDHFDAALKFSDRLSKPIFVEDGLQAFAQWLMTVLMETRRDGQWTTTIDGQAIQIALQPDAASDGAPLWNAANQLLRIILRNDAARFGWFGRLNPQKIGIDFGDGRAVAGLDALSAGQASLLLIFGTLLRYADSSSAFTGFGNIKGICVADEIDAHLHIDLQTAVLPDLIALFPAVQFIMSSHSPFFALAMEKRFGVVGSRLFDLDTGAYTTADAFSEFSAAFEAMAETERFENAVLAQAQAVGRPLILLEGETDAKYIRKAAEVLGKSSVLDTVDIQWVGERQSGNATNTGKSALNHAFNTLRSNSNITNRPVLLLYDCDTMKPPEDLGSLHVRAIPMNAETTIAQDGIENLLPDSVFHNEMYDVVERSGSYGNSTITRQLNKTRLCDALCGEDTDPSTYDKFGVVFEIIESVFKINL